MAKKSNIKGFKQLQQKLNKRSKEAAKGRVSVIVGYTKNYAVHVHEMTMKSQGEKRTGLNAAGNPAKGKYWDPQGRAGPKFLERPARDKTVQATMRKIIKAAMKKVPDMRIALVAAGLYLQAKSQNLVPVDTGDLKGSAFTRLEK